MFKPKKQIWRDNTEPPKNYIWERLNESGSYVGTFEYNGEHWVKIKDKTSSEGGSCSCEDKFVPLVTEKSVVYINDEKGGFKYLSYSEEPKNGSFVVRTSDGRIKSNDAKEQNDVVTLKDICWNE